MDEELASRVEQRAQNEPFDLGDYKAQNSYDQPPEQPVRVPGAGVEVLRKSVQQPSASETVSLQISQKEQDGLEGGVILVHKRVVHIQ